MFLYKITNSINGKSYIGITSKTTRSRFTDHVHQSARNETRSALHAAFRKYGRSNFKAETIASAADYESLLKMEQAAIEIYATAAPSGYNITLGGQGHLGHSPSNETRAKLAAASASAWSDPAYKRALGDAQRIAWKTTGRASAVDEWNKSFWSGENRLAAASAAQRRWKNEANRTAAAALLKARWADPEFREKMLSARRAG